MQKETRKEDNGSLEFPTISTNPTDFDKSKKRSSEIPISYATQPWQPEPELIVSAITAHRSTYNGTQEHQTSDRLPEAFRFDGVTLKQQLKEAIPRLRHVDRTEDKSVK